MFIGAFTALVTPFKNGGVDEEAFKAFIEYQINNGADGIVPCGTTGESATLTYEEHNRVIELAIETAAGRVPVIAGTGSNSTSETVMLTKHAEKAGADGALLITPYYNKPTQQGLYEHYRSVAEEVSIPLILYNVPGRTGVNMRPETVARLSEFKNIVGIKEASADLNQISNIIEYCEDEFVVLSGDDFTTLPLLSIGGKGVISVTANVLPGRVSGLCRTFLDGKVAEAKKIHYELQPLNRAMFLETNPIPVKTALSLMGLMDEEFRLPLVKMNDENRKKLKDTLESYGIEIKV